MIGDASDGTTLFWLVVLGIVGLFVQGWIIASAVATGIQWAADRRREERLRQRAEDAELRRREERRAERARRVAARTPEQRRAILIMRVVIGVVLLGAIVAAAMVFAPKILALLRKP
jgi:hypothetical protein